MKRQSVLWVCVLVLGILPAVQASLIWNADFESPPYVLNGYLTQGNLSNPGPDGWWSPQNYKVGLILNKDGSQQARMGAGNGYATVALSKLFSTEIGTGEQLNVSFTYQPGIGTTSNLLALTNSSNAHLIQINFDATTGHILAVGTTAYDTNVAWVGGTYYDVEVTADASGFDVAINGVTVAQDRAFNLASYTTTGRFYWYGGGNGGVSAAYSYMDNLVVSTVPEPVTFVIIGLGTGAMVLRKRLQA